MEHSAKGFSNKDSAVRLHIRYLYPHKVPLSNLNVTSGLLSSKLQKKRAVKWVKFR